MAKTDEYLDEACRTLFEISADEEKRLEYEAREKALKDYNSQMSSAEKRGLERGFERGEKIGLQRGTEIGIKRGTEIGMKRGTEIGIKHGQDQINKLNRLLAEHNRTDDIIKASRDSEYQAELLKEFNL